MRISDALRTLEYLFQGAVALACEKAADADDDGRVTLSDAIYTMQFLVGGAAAVPAPYPRCGVDPTRDPLGCARSAACP